MVDGSALTLTVGAIATLVAFDGSALIKVDAVVFQRIDKHFHSTGDFPLGVGIFHTQEENAARLMAHTLRNGALNQVAQMDKTGGGGSHTGDDGTFGELPCGEPGLHLLGSLGYIGKQ